MYFICIKEDIFMIKTRIAPSPTWKLHIGTVIISLYNRIIAKQNNWKFIMRIEDTDLARSTKENEDNIIEWLKRLGLDYDIWPNKNDENWPYRQMERLEIYQKYIKKLINEWKAYYARETDEELKELREKAQKEKKWFVYRQINYTEEQIKNFKNENRKPIIRFKVQAKIVEFEDMVKWKLKFDMKHFGDFAIQKSDWSPTFYIANVVDDYLMWMSHIIRWEDHVSNTPKQILLYEALWWKHPKYWHLALLLNSDWTKMSKRNTWEALTIVNQFQENWFLPEALINFIVLLWRHPSSDREFFTKDELLKEFSTDRFTPSNAIYDWKRCLWFNSEYIKKLEDQKFIKILQNYLKKYWDNEWKEYLKNDINYWLKFAPEIKQRLQNLKQFKDFAKYFFKYQSITNEILYKSKMKVDKDLVKKIIPIIIELCKNIDIWEVENIKEYLIKFIKESNLKNWQVLRPIRSILTWVEASPGAFEMMYILWKSETINRLEKFYKSNFI